MKKNYNKGRSYRKTSDKQEIRKKGRTTNVVKRKNEKGRTNVVKVEEEKDEGGTSVVVGKVEVYMKE